MPDQALDCFVVECGLAMAGKVLKMGPDNGRTLLYYPLHDCRFAVGYRFAFDNLDRTFRAGADAGPEPVAEEIAYEPGLIVNDLERPFRTVRDALATACTFRLINADDVPLHRFLLRPVSYNQVSVFRTGNGKNPGTVTNGTAVKEPKNKKVRGVQCRLFSARYGF
jgi:hypothetical protein